jgi:hypothetical protein
VFQYQISFLRQYQILKHQVIKVKKYLQQETFYIENQNILLDKLAQILTGLSIKETGFSVGFSISISNNKLHCRLTPKYL